MTHWKKESHKTVLGKTIEIVWRNKKTNQRLIVFRRGYTIHSKEWGVATEPPLKLKGYFNRKQAFKKARAVMNKWN